MLVVSNAEIEEFYKEIWLYETVPGDQIICNKLVGCYLPEPFNWTDRPYRILSMWFSLSLQLEDLLEIRKKVKVALYLWLPRNPLLKWVLLN